MDNSEQCLILDSNLKIGATPPPSECKGLTDIMYKFYMQRISERKGSFDQLGAEVSQRQEKMKLINDIIAEINTLTDEQHALDITNDVVLQEKLRVAKELGVKIPEGQTKFTPMQRDRLIENLHIASDGWNNENKTQTQKMQIHMNELDRIIMLLTDAQKKDREAKRKSSDGMRT